jgi:hypothetical protein
VLTHTLSYRGFQFRDQHHSRQVPLELEPPRSSFFPRNFRWGKSEAVGLRTKGPSALPLPLLPHKPAAPRRTAHPQPTLNSATSPRPRTATRLGAQPPCGQCGTRKTPISTVAPPPSPLTHPTHLPSPIHQLLRHPSVVRSPNDRLFRVQDCSGLVTRLHPMAQNPGVKPKPTRSSRMPTLEEGGRGVTGGCRGGGLRTESVARSEARAQASGGSQSCIC